MNKLRTIYNLYKLGKLLHDNFENIPSINLGNDSANLYKYDFYSIEDLGACHVVEFINGKKVLSWSKFIPDKQL